MELQLTGLAEMVAKLRALRAEVSGPGMKRALRAGGSVIRAAMEERTPVLDAKTPGSTSLAPGELRAGMRVYVPKNETPAVAIIGPSAKVEHVARFVEYGHRQVSGGYSKVTVTGKVRGPGRAGRDVPAHPFLRPAFEASVGEAGEVFRASVEETIQKTVS